jgi:hypothetical protein
MANSRTFCGSGCFIPSPNTRKVFVRSYGCGGHGGRSVHLSQGCFCGYVNGGGGGGGGYGAGLVPVTPCTPYPVTVGLGCTHSSSFTGNCSKVVGATGGSAGGVGYICGSSAFPGPGGAGGSGYGNAVTTTGNGRPGIAGGPGGCGAPPGGGAGGCLGVIGSVPGGGGGGGSYCGGAGGSGAHGRVTICWMTATASASPASGAIPLRVAFRATPCGGSAPYTYAWCFGCGKTSTCPNPTHTYAKKGTYHPTVTVTANCGLCCSPAVPAVTATCGGMSASGTLGNLSVGRQHHPKISTPHAIVNNDSDSGPN